MHYDSEEEWIPENEEINTTSKVGEHELRHLAAKIGLRYHKPQSVITNVRPRRNRRKTSQFVPTEQLRDYRGAKKRQADARLRKEKDSAQSKQKSENDNATDYAVKRKTSDSVSVNTKRKCVTSNACIVPNKTNVFGGVNAKKQRLLFSSKIITSVHRPLDVYKGMCCYCMYISNKQKT